MGMNNKIKQGTALIKRVAPIEYTQTRIISLFIKYIKLKKNILSSILKILLFLMNKA